MLTDRMMRAAMLDSGLYEEVEHDLSATSQALTVVVLAALAAGISGGISATLAGHPGQAVTGVLGGVVSGIVGWVVWSVVAYFVGTRVFGGTATPGELLRVIGFADTPNVLLIFGFVPLVGGLISLVVAIWSLVAGVIAVRQALDFDTTKAVLTIVVGAIAMVVVMAILGALGLTFLRFF